MKIHHLMIDGIQLKWCSVIERRKDIVLLSRGNGKEEYRK